MRWCCSSASRCPRTCHRACRWKGQGLLAELPAGLPSELLERRPDVRQAERQLRAANANIGAARAAFFPRITLTGSAAWPARTCGGLFENRAWQFAPRITLPIFDAGRNQANLEAEPGERATSPWRSTSVRSRPPFAKSPTRSPAVPRWANNCVRSARRRRPRKRAVRLADLRYQNGASSYLDVLDAQRTLFLVQQGVVIAQAAQVQNLVTLYKVLGGGWSAPAANPD